MNPEIIAVQTEHDLAVVKNLFLQYQAFQEPLGVQLEFQNFQAEMANLPGPYRPPQGNLYLALHQSQAVGCAAFYQLQPGICEIKRLFVKPSSQGLGLGKALLQRVLLDAKTAGYQFARLDSVRRLAKAARLYTQFGFQEIPPFNANPNKDVYYMELTLTTYAPPSHSLN